MPKKSDSEWILQLEQVALLKGHRIIEVLRDWGEPITRKSKISIFCKKCSQSFTKDSIESYLNNVESCPGCYERTHQRKKPVMSDSVKAQAVEKRKATLAQKRLDFLEQHKENDLVFFQNKSLTPTTITNSNKPVEASAAWKAVMFQAYQGVCFIDKTKGLKDDPLVVHHLYSRDAFPELVEHLRNGVLIKQSYHREFHRQFGLGQNTPAQFERFLANHCQMEGPYPWSLESFVKSNEALVQKFEIQKKYFEKDFLSILKKRKHKLIQYLWEDQEGCPYENIDTLAEIECLVCPQPATEIKSVRNYKRSLYGLSCCEKNFRKARDKPTFDKSTFLEEIALKKHEYLGCVASPDIVSTKTEVLIRCQKHNTVLTTTPFNYRRSKHGLSCCAFEERVEKSAVTVLKHKKNIDSLFKRYSDDLDKGDVNI